MQLPLIGGFVLLFFPNEGLKPLLSNGDYGDVFPRVAGMLLAGLGITVLGIILTRSEALYPVTLFVRACFLAGFAAFYWLSHVMKTSNNPKQLLNAAVMALAALIMWCTFSVIIIVIRMTKRILRAIEISARLG